MDTGNVGSLSTYRQAGAKAAAGGTMLVLLPSYGYWQGILTCLVIMIISVMVTHKTALSASVTFISLPFIAWVGTKSLLLAVWAITLGVLMGLRALPTAISDWSRAENKREFFFGRRRP